MPARNRRTRTVQFRGQDVIFRRNQQVIPHSASLEQLSSADTVTLWLDNQKNGQRGATLHHTAASGTFCPVKALARRVKAITHYNMPPDTPLSYVSPGLHVTSTNVVSAVRTAVEASGLLTQGYCLKQVVAHSLRASGAMALKLNGYDKTDIMKFGRWSSTTFLTYIHSQIGALSAGVANRMSRRIAFFNVSGESLLHAPQA